MAPRRFDLIVFDLDGVLVDTSPCHSAAYEALWREIGIVGPPYSAVAGRRTRETVVEFAGSVAASEDQIEDWIRFKQERARSEIGFAPILFEDTLRCLERLAAAGYELALATAASRETAEIVLRRFDLGSRFSIVVTGDDVEAGKPSPEVYSRTIAAEGVRPARSLAVEDSPTGAQAALGAGCWVALVRSGARMVNPRFLGSFPGLDAMLSGLELVP